MKTKEELNALKEEVKAVNKKLAELTEEELEQVSGGFRGDSDYTTTYRKTCSNCGYILREAFLSGCAVLANDDDLLSECPQCHKAGTGEWHIVI